MHAVGLRRLPCLARAYSTALPDAAQAARTASTPLAVKERRQKKFGAVEPTETDANKNGLTPTEVQRYNRLKALGELPKINGEVPTPEVWSKTVNERRSRIRGFRKVKSEDGQTLVQPVGQRVYLPNIIFKLVRNHTPPGEPYNPYEATFRIPKSVTKTDIRSYLDAVYGVKATYIRTDVYHTPAPTRGRPEAAHKSYKRAVVGLVEPFYYPHRLEDMSAEARAKREEWIETEFAIKKTDEQRKAEMLRQTIGHGSAAFRFRPENATRRSHILQLVTERKLKREQLVGEFAKKITEKREAGEDITYASLAAKAKPVATIDASSSS